MESAENEVDTLSTRMSGVGEYECSQKRYRYSEEDDANDECYWAPRNTNDPCAHEGGSSSRYVGGVSI